MASEVKVIVFNCDLCSSEKTRTRDGLLAGCDRQCGKHSQEYARAHALPDEKEDTINDTD